MHRILQLQDKVDFVILFLDEDIPLYVDSFLLWIFYLKWIIEYMI